MSDNAAPVDYNSVGKENEDRVFGATSVVDNVPLIYDETNSMWVLAEDRDEPWDGTLPVVDSHDACPNGEQVKCDEPINYVEVIPLEGKKLNLRKDPSVDGEILSAIVEGTVLQVIDAANAEWCLVATVTDIGVTMTGYVKNDFIIETSAPADV